MKNLISNYTDEKGNVTLDGPTNVITVLKRENW